MIRRIDESFWDENMDNVESSDNSIECTENTEDMFCLSVWMLNPFGPLYSLDEMVSEHPEVLKGIKTVFNKCDMIADKICDISGCDIAEAVYAMCDGNHDECQGTHRELLNRKVYIGKNVVEGGKVTVMFVRYYMNGLDFDSISKEKVAQILKTVGNISAFDDYKKKFGYYVDQVYVYLSKNVQKFCVVSNESVFNTKRESVDLSPVLDYQYYKNTDQESRFEINRKNTQKATKMLGSYRSDWGYGDTLEYFYDDELDGNDYENYSNHVSTHWSVKLDENKFCMPEIIGNEDEIQKYINRIYMYRCIDKNYNAKWVWELSQITDQQLRSVTEQVKDRNFYLTGYIRDTVVMFDLFFDGTVNYNKEEYTMKMGVFSLRRDIVKQLVKGTYKKWCDEMGGDDPEQWYGIAGLLYLIAGSGEAAFEKFKKYWSETSPSITK